MGCPALRHEVLQDRGKRPLGQVLIDHGPGSSSNLSELSSPAQPA
jgi:hypothetical protein